MTTDVPDAATILEQASFDPDESVLTRRQAEVLALRERGLPQAAIADRLGTSRANVSSVESSARRNVRRARETIAVADALGAPVRVEVGSDTDIYEVPDRVYDACDEQDIKVDAPAPELIATVNDAAKEALDGRRFVEPVTIAVTPEGELRVRVR